MNQFAFRCVWRAIAVLVGLFITLGVAAAPVGDFYRSALENGKSLYAAGKYEAAIKSLQIAAFGSADDLPTYQHTYAYIALAASKLHNEGMVGVAFVKINQVEAIRPTAVSLTLGKDRAEFDKLAQRYGFVASAGPPPPVPARVQATISPAPAPVAPSVRPAPAVTTSNPPAMRAPAPQPVMLSSTPPARAQTATPKPATVAAEEGRFALQIGIACQAATVEAFRAKLGTVHTAPITVRGKSCYKVMTGSFPSRERAIAARDEVRRRAQTPDLPIVVSAGS